MKQGFLPQNRTQNWISVSAEESGLSKWFGMMHVCSSGVDLEPAPSRSWTSGVSDSSDLSNSFNKHYYKWLIQHFVSWVQKYYLWYIDKGNSTSKGRDYGSIYLNFQPSWYHILYHVLINQRYFQHSIIRDRIYHFKNYLQCTSYTNDLSIISDLSSTLSAESVYLFYLFITLEAPSRCQNKNRNSSLFELSL